MRLADAPREMDSQSVIQVGNVDTTSNFEVSGAALNIATNKKVNVIDGYMHCELNQTY